MRSHHPTLALALALFAGTVGAQTTITTSGGTTNTVPVFTGSATLGNSAITQSGGNVGIGTSTPQGPLQVVGTGTNVIILGESSVTSGHQLVLGINNSGNGYGVIQSVYQQHAFTPIAINQFGGNVGIGTSTPGASLEVNGNVKLTSGSGASITFADGTVQSTAYTGVTCGGDYAETVDVAGNRSAYEPGDIMVLSKEAGADVVKSSEQYSTAVAGIYSTKPGVVGRRQTTDPKTSVTEIPMAMVGIVPTKVSAENGSIQRGDLLVTSSTAGYAMKGTDRSRMLGAVVGKALGNLDSGTGIIEVLVTLQ